MDYTRIDIEAKRLHQIASYAVSIDRIHIQKSHFQIKSKGRNGETTLCL
jgi:hypothetical protein